MITKIFTNVLVLSPHTDDAEIGAGGTIAKLIENDVNVSVVVFSKASSSKKYDTLKEFSKSMSILGVHKKNTIIKSFPTRNLDRYRQEILEYLYKISQETYYDLIILPSKNDKHQDHEVIAKEGHRAFSKSSIISYKISSNNVFFHNNLFISLNKNHIKLKTKALRQYKSQKNKFFMDSRNVEINAKYQGFLSNNKYSEAFEIIQFYL